MNILHKKTGTFIFLDKEGEMKTYKDYNDVPDLSEFQNLICFYPDVPYPPHSVEDHEIIEGWNEEMARVMKEIHEVDE